MGRMEATVETRRFLVPPRGGGDSLVFYNTIATFPLGGDDQLNVDAMARTPADQQRILSIIQSIRMRDDSTLKR